MGRLVRRREAVAGWPPRARLAHGLATLTAALALIGQVWFNVWGFLATLAQMTGVPPVFSAIPLSFTAAALVGLTLVLRRPGVEGAVLIARDPRTLQPRRTHTAVARVAYLYSWNLFGASV